MVAIKGKLHLLHFRLDAEGLGVDGAFTPFHAGLFKEQGVVGFDLEICAQVLGRDISQFQRGHPQQLLGRAAQGGQIVKA